MKIELQGVRIIPVGPFAALVDEQDFERLAAHSWQPMPRPKGRYYARRFSHGKHIMMHRIVLGTADGADTDHRNENSLDNRRENLREASRSENMANRGLPAHNTSGFKGVSWSAARLKWEAKITQGRKTIHLGRYENIEDAVWAYKKAAEQLFGEFAKTDGN